jgi:histidinol-phosphate aminotransferase
MAIDLTELATPGIASLPTYKPGKSAAEVQRELGLARAIKLASNENSLGPSKKVLDALADGALTKDRFDLCRYPDGSGSSLKRALADFHGINPDQVTLGNGSNDVLELVARSIVTSAHEVIYSENAFIVYHLATHSIGATPVVIPTRDHRHDLAAILDAVTGRTRLIFLDNPGNPTGNWIDGNRLRSFLASVPEDVIVVVDEAYYEYAASLCAEYPNSIEFQPDFPNLVTTRTFSKAYGLAGLRVGYAISHPDLADLMNRVRQPFNVNTLALLAAEVALKDQEHLRRSVAMNDNGMLALTAAFAELGLGWFESIANFVSFDLGQPADDIYQALLREGVVVRPIIEYGLPDHLRVTIGQEHENAEFIKALGKVLMNAV